VIPFFCGRNVGGPLVLQILVHLHPNRGAPGSFSFFGANFPIGREVGCVSHWCFG